MKVLVILVAQGREGALRKDGSKGLYSVISSGTHGQQGNSTNDEGDGRFRDSSSLRSSE